MHTGTAPAPSRDTAGTIRNVIVYTNAHVTSASSAGKAHWAAGTDQLGAIVEIAGMHDTYITLRAAVCE